MTAPSTTQTKRRQLFGIILGAVLLPALVAIAVPDRSGDAEVATVPIAAESAPVDTAGPSTTTEAPTTSTSASATTASTPTVSAASAKTKSTTSTTPPTTVAAKKVAYVAPATTTTTAAPAPPPAPSDGGAQAFLACIRRRESGGNYSIVSSNGQYHGAYQFSQSTWDSIARRAGRTDLVGVPPSQASAGDQDAMALALYNSQGKAPWGGYC